VCKRVGEGRPVFSSDVRGVVPWPSWLDEASWWPAVREGGERKRKDGGGPRKIMAAAGKPEAMAEKGGGKPRGGEQPNQSFCERATARRCSPPF
jgi:hypothetical protein